MVAEVQLLAKLGKSRPHAAYSALTHGLSSRWHYVFRVVPNVAVFATLGGCDPLHFTSGCVGDIFT